VFCILRTVSPTTHGPHHPTFQHIARQHADRTHLAEAHVLKIFTDVQLEFRSSFGAPRQHKHYPVHSATAMEHVGLTGVCSYCHLHNYHNQSVTLVITPLPTTVRLLLRATVYQHGAVLLEKFFKGWTT